MNYNQSDPIYKKIFLGNSKKYTLYSDGCYVFSLAHILGIDPILCNDKLKASGCFMADSTDDYCLLDHTKIKLAFPDRIIDVEKVDTYDNVKCLAAIDEYGHCIVKVDYDGSNSTVFDTHFVDFMGNKTLFDSLGGKEKPTSTYPILKGLRIVKLKPITQEETMTDDQKRALDIINKYKISANHGNLEGAANAAVSATVELKNAQEKISGLDDSIQKSAQVINELTLKVKQNEVLTTEWQTKVATAEENLGKMTEDRDAKWTQYKNKNDDYNTLLERTQNPSELIKMFINLFKK